MGLLPSVILVMNLKTPIQSIIQRNILWRWGLSKIYFGGAYKVNSNFSIGINASYVFGGLNRRKINNI